MASKRRNIQSTMALSRALLLALVLVGLIAVGLAFDSRPYENKPTKPFNPPMPTSPPWKPRYRRAPAYLEDLDYQYQPESVHAGRTNIMTMSRALLLALLLVGLIAVGLAFDSRPYENKPTKPFNPPMPTSPPWKPRYRRAPAYLEDLDYEYQPESVDGARYRRFTAPIVVVPLPAPPPPPPMA
ncbi:hypothetical protein AAG570_009054 [Ranatra chinensis]|uniref:Uncharacterized protein n=1 Tax=Ranatra chinensis TaxID=642074 RepID=A0ABD0YSM7_9HEMI